MTPADYDRLLTVIRALLDRQARVIAAIDGRCGAGKSTLAAQLQAQLSCRVFHMDDFFLRPEQRTAARLAQPGENVDHERFLSEVLQPALRGEAVTYHPFRCARQALFLRSLLSCGSSGPALPASPHSGAGLPPHCG